MPDDPRSLSDKGYLDALRRERESLIDQIRRSQETIERSQELIKQLDELLAKSGRQP
jgi:hypothetical protein